MTAVVYNLNSIRPPITGIGRYAIELLRGGLGAEMEITAVRNRRLYDQSSLDSVFSELETTHRIETETLRKYGGKIPFSREIYRRLNASHFSRLADPLLSKGAICHDINYSFIPKRRSGLTTIYDLSHKKCPDTHPYHRVRFLDTYFSKLANSDYPIITISHNVKNDLLEAYDIAQERIHVTHLAADQQFHPREESQCAAILQRYKLKYKGYLLCVGTREPRKNLSSVLSAYCSLPDEMKQAYPLVIAGPSGWKHSQHEHRIQQLHEQGQIIKLGYVPQTDLPELYAAATAFIYPSLYEGFGLPLLEAMQSGCPCITSNSGALAEVADGNALQINPLDAEELADKLTVLLQDTDTNQHYANAGRQRAQMFSWSDTVAATHRIYESL